MCEQVVGKLVIESVSVYRSSLKPRSGSSGGLCWLKLFHLAETQQACMHNADVKLAKSEHRLVIVAVVDRWWIAGDAK